jgi:hypothetical protein
MCPIKMEENKVFDLYVGEQRVVNEYAVLNINTVFNVRAQPLSEHVSCVLERFEYDGVRYTPSRSSDLPSARQGLCRVRATVWVTPKETRVSEKHVVLFDVLGEAVYH